MKKNMNDSREEKIDSFSKGNTNLPLETEAELLLKKMKRMHKKKNNYKNIDVLENIYDTKPSKKDNYGLFAGISDFIDNLDAVEQNMNELNIEGFDDDDQEGMDDDDDQEGMDDDDDQEGMDDDDDQEGFKENADNLYTGQYEGKYTYTGRQMVYKDNKPSKKKKSKKKKSKKKSSKKKSSKKRSSKKSSKKSAPPPPDEIGRKIKQFFRSIFHFNPKTFIRNRIAKPTYDKISGEHPKNNRDIEIITNQLIYLVYACIITIISGNWYYLMCYKNDLKQRESSSAKFYKFPNKIINSGGMFAKSLRLIAQFQPLVIMNIILCEVFAQVVPILHSYATYPFYIIFKYVLGGKWLFPSELEYLTNVYKAILSNNQFLYIAFTFFIIFCIMKYSSSLYNMYVTYKNALNPKTYKNMFKKSKTGKTLQSYQLILSIIMFELFIGATSVMLSVLTKMGIQTESSNVSNTIKSVMEGMKTYAMIIAAPILFCIMFLIALFINITLIPISALMCVIYLYVYSYFGAYLRSGTSGNAFNKMFARLDDQNPCDSSFSGVWMDMINKFIAFIYNNLTMVILVLYCIWSIKIYFSKIVNKHAAGFLIGAQILIIIFAIIISIINSSTKKVDLRDYNYIEPFNQ